MAAEQNIEVRRSEVESFFEPLLCYDASGRDWLPALLRATPGAAARLAEVLDRPGSLIAPLAVRGVSGRLGCFEQPALPPRELLAWYVEHPDALVWPRDDGALSAETRKLRSALLRDDPPGSRPRAQERARELLPVRSPLSREWWRFEEATILDCALITDRLVVTVLAAGSAGLLTAASEWYPQRSSLVRTIEAAKGLAHGRVWASLVLSGEPLPGATPEHLAGTLAAGAPHLSADARAELGAAYLGNLTWRDAATSVAGMCSP